MAEIMPLSSLTGPKRALGSITDNIRTSTFDNKSIEVFGSDNKTQTVTVPQAEETRDNEKAKKKRMWKKIGLAVLGAVVVAGTIIVAKKLSSNANNIAETAQKTLTEEIGTNTQLQKTADFNIFKDFEICENLSTTEKKSFHNMISSANSDSEFYPTLIGKRAVGETYNFNGEDITYLSKLKLPKGIEILYSYPTEVYGVNREYCISFVNKPELFKIFERNKEIFTKRLGLDINADNEVIYSKIKDSLRFKEAFVDNIPNNKLKHDLYGMCMGFPKYNTMIFQLERTGEIPITLRDNPIEYKKQIMAVLHGENSPYTNLSKKELKKLEESINNITAPKRSNRSPYEVYIEMTEERDEFKRIETAAREFNKIFSVDNMIKGIYS